MLKASKGPINIGKSEDPQGVKLKENLMATQPIDDGAVDLWYVHSDHLIDEHLIPSYLAMLAGEEKKQLARFAVTEPRHQYLISRVLVRTVLSCYTNVAPWAWVFKQNKYGKPKIAGPVRIPLEFNLSHTRGLIVCGVTTGRALGVDVEVLKQSPDYLQLARHFFSPVEVEALECLPVDEQQKKFIQLWTLKEAYIKARGKGLSIPLNKFGFVLSPCNPPRLILDRLGNDDSREWQFAQGCLESRFQIAIALHLPIEKRLIIRVRETVPLAWHGEDRLILS